MASTRLQPDADRRTPGRLRFPRDCRLRKRSEISRVYSEGVRVRGRLLLVVAAPGGNPDSARLALSVSRKFNKSAVLRNKLRRRMREAFRLERAGLPRLDVVLIPMARDTEYTLQLLRDDLVTLLARAERKLQ